VDGRVVGFMTGLVLGFVGVGLVDGLVGFVGFVGIGRVVGRDGLGFLEGTGFI